MMSSGGRQETTQGLARARLPLWLKVTDSREVPESRMPRAHLEGCIINGSGDTENASNNKRGAGWQFKGVGWHLAL